MPLPLAAAAGAAGMSTLGGAIVAIAADMSPLTKALGGMKDVLQAPMQGAADIIKSTLGDAFDVGGAIEKLGATAGGRLGQILENVPIIGGTLGPLAEGAVTHTASLMGRIASAITGPMRSALSTSLTDLDRWVAAAQLGEEKVIRWKDELRKLGGVSMLTGDKLQEMAGDLTQSQLESLLGVSWQEVERVIVAQGGRLGAALAGSLTAKVKRLQDTWGDIGTSLGEAFLPAAKLVTDVGQQIVGTLRGYLLPVFGQLKAGISGVVGNIQGFLTANAGTFRYWGGTIRQIINNVAGLVKTGFGALFAMLTPEKGGNFWGPFNSGVTRALEIVANLTGSWEDVSAAASFAWEEIKDYAIDFWEATGELAMSAWETVKEYAASAWEEIKGYGAATWEEMPGISEGAWQAIGDFGRASWQTIGDFGRATWDVIKDAASAVWEGIGAFGRAAYEGIANVWNQGFEGLWERLKSGFNTVWEYITGKLSKISDYFKEWFGMAQAQAAGAAEGQRIDEKMNAINKRREQQQAEQQKFEGAPEFVGPKMPVKVEIAEPPERAPQDQREDKRRDRREEMNQLIKDRDKQRQDDAARRDREDAKKDKERLKLREEEKKQEKEVALQQVKTSGLAEFHSMIQQSLKPETQVPKQQLDEQKKTNELLKDQKAMQQQMLQKVFGGPQAAILG